MLQFLSFITLFAQSDYKMVVERNNGSKVFFKINDLKQVYFIKDNYEEDTQIEYNPHGLWTFQKTIAIDRTTFASSNYYLRIPFCETTNEGTIIVGTDIREETTSDHTKISIGIVRSTDGGLTFNYPQVIIPHTDESPMDRAMDGTILVDRTTGRIFVFAHRIVTNNIWEDSHTMGDYGYSCEYVYSDDDGLTWSSPKSLSDVLISSLKGVVSLFGGVGHGITMEDGTLVLPIQCKMAMYDDDRLYNIQSGIIYSNDHGETWHASNSLVPCWSSENMAVEYDSGKIMVNCKSYIGLRRVFVTTDMGDTWLQHETDAKLIEPFACQGTLHKIGRWGFFLNPRNSKTRSNITLQITDDYITWKPVLELSEGTCFGYSCLCNSGKYMYAVTESNGESVIFFRIINE